MVKVETVVCDIPVDLVMNTARDTLQTGEVGDGKIFVYDVEDSMRIRTGTRGTKAVTDDEVQYMEKMGCNKIPLKPRMRLEDTQVSSSRILVILV